MSQANEKNIEKDPTSIVNIVANECHEGETAVDDIAPQLVSKPHIVNASCYRDMGA